MKYSGSLVKEERAKIFKLFLNNQKLKFSEIEKETQIRSNMVSYHIEKMQEDGLLEKRGEYYYLTKNAEKYMPIFSNIVGEELSPLPVILVGLTNKNNILLIKRYKRPYKGYWSLIGGKMLFEESFKEASLRQIKEKVNINGKYVSINGVMHERVKGEDVIKHSFILFFTKIKTNETKFVETRHGKLRWFPIKNIGKKEKIIPSDLWLIKNRLSNKIDVKTAKMSEEEGELSNFKIDYD
jgi:ADP-ribose pyrophosphatase YjhB (NUDIX family)